MGNGGVGTTNVPDTVYVPAMVWFADADTSTLVLSTYDVDAMSASATPGTKHTIKIPHINFIAPQKRKTASEIQKRLEVRNYKTV